MPLNNLDLENPMASEAYEELSPLLRRIDDQNHRIERQISEIKEQKEEFLQIAENMSEGLAVLDANGFILTVNESAKKLLGTGDFPLAGRHVLALSRSEQLREAAEAALKGKAFERDIESGQKMLRIFLNPVFEGNKVSGAILLILDITEKYKAEKTRREFSANVSHELKTPLTSISGYAELMKNGMVKSEDIERFSGRIYEESTRLLSLIEDIIRLSKLDEGDIRSEKRKIGLLESAENVSKRLFDQAQKHNIKISVEGEEAFILAVPQLLEELIYNLLENAIKYNKEDGEVTITISKNEDRATLLVADTGIGIPSEQRERVFERFYRVDKSHSKETGGTGLGLSIVKHIAAYHSATIDLQSKEGEGTIVTISFPRN